MTTQARQVLYGLLSAAGLCGTMFYNVQYAQQAESPGSLDFFGSGFANPASSSITVDLAVTCLVFFVFVVVEGRRLGMRHLWAYMVFSLAGALAAMFPLFLLVRERNLHAK